VEWSPDFFAFILVLAEANFSGGEFLVLREEAEGLRIDELIRQSESE
jgi:hypothetical protein